MSLCIHLPHPAKELSPNGRLHPHAKAKLTKEHRQRAKMTTLSMLDSTPCSLGWTYEITWKFKGQRPDIDNVAGLCKAYLDGICDACQYNDRNFTDLRIRFQKVNDKSEACVLLHFPF